MTASAGAALLAGVCAASAATAATVPYHAVLEVKWGEGEGSEAFRTDLGHALADGMSNGCFTSVVLADGDADGARGDLLLSVLLSHVQEDVRYEDTIAGALQPGEPTRELRRVADFEVTVDSALETLAARRPIASKRLTAGIARRPMIPGEDAAAVARQLAVERIVSDLRKAYCRGGAKLQRKVERALAETAPQAPPAR